MHELGIALEVVDAALRRCEGARVRRIRLEVGVLTAVSPQALSFCFELAAQDTLAADAELVIDEPAARATCRACQRALVLTGPLGRCECGSVDVAWLSGEELRIVEMEVEICAEPADAVS